jgi:manganese transport protein
LAGGSTYNYTLLAVIQLSNLMAVLRQTLALNLGVVTGRDLAAAFRDHFSCPVSFVSLLDQGRGRHRRLLPCRSDRFGHRS